MERSDRDEKRDNTLVLEGAWINSDCFPCQSPLIVVGFYRDALQIIQEHSRERALDGGFVNTSP